jgi:mRNA degradation ribonuclease J1/J2
MKNVRVFKCFLSPFLRDPKNTFSPASCYNGIEDAIGYAVYSGISNILVTGDFNLNIL